MMIQPSDEEKRIYSVISSSDGIKARAIAETLGMERKLVNHHLFSSPLMKELCWEDSGFRWHSLIRQTYPHAGLNEYAGYYSTVKEFLSYTEAEWLSRLEEGCRNIGRNLNDTRGLIHSFTDCRKTVIGLFSDLKELSGPDHESWEIAFELRIKTSRRIRIYADVLIITDRYVFSLEFKMKDSVDPDEVAQAFKYCEYEDLIFGRNMEVVPVLVLTRAHGMYEYRDVKNTDASVQVCSGDMLYNVFDEYYRFLK